MHVYVKRANTTTPSFAASDSYLSNSAAKEPGNRELYEDAFVLFWVSQYLTPSRAKYWTICDKYVYFVCFYDCYTF